MARAARRAGVRDRAELVEHFARRGGRGSSRSTARSPCRCRCGCARAASSTGGASGCSPSNMRSVPIMCATLSWTDHPGQSVGRSHCSSVRSAHTSTMSPHTSSNNAINGSVMWLKLPARSEPEQQRQRRNEERWDRDTSDGLQKSSEVFQILPCFPGFSGVSVSPPLYCSRHVHEGSRCCRRRGACAGCRSRSGRDSVVRGARRRGRCSTRSSGTRRRRRRLLARRVEDGQHVADGRVPVRGRAARRTCRVVGHDREEVASRPPSG